MHYVGRTVLCLALLICGASCTQTMRILHEPQAPPASAQLYIASMYDRIEIARKQLPIVQLAGQAAARRVINGGYIWAGGSQGDFGAEAIGRAGGLMGVRALDPALVYRKDVVLYGARGSLSANDLAVIAQCKQAGAYVIAFAAAQDSVRTPQGPDLLIDCGSMPGLLTDHGICPLDTVTNLLNLWCFTGEYVAACTRLGKTPVIYESYGLEDGRERDARYEGQMFHNDISVAAVRPGVLGNQYLDRIAQILKKVQHDDIDDITQAGRWIGGTAQQNLGLQVIAHIYPDHFHDPRAAQPIKASAGQNEPAPKKVVLIHISYQRPPQDLIDASRREHTRLFSCSVLRGRGGIAENTLYANPHWPLEDACVQLPGYDIPILPASAVIQATIYWSMVAEAYRAP